MILKAYLLLGSNLGNRNYYLQQATKHIESWCGSVLQYSSVYQTAAWGLQQQPNFLNIAISIATPLLPEALMQKLLTIEKKLGRERTIKMGPRTIDIDILLIENCVQKTKLLTIPHPALPQRRFALLPLAEIAPDLLHPIKQKTIAQLLQSCADTLLVEKL